MLMIIIMLSSLDTMLAVWSPVINAPFFPGLFFYVHIKSSNPKNPEGPTPQAQTLGIGNPNSINQI